MTPSSQQEHWFAEYLLSPTQNGKLREANAQLAAEKNRHPDNYNGKMEIHVGVLLNTEVHDYSSFERAFEKQMEALRKEGGIADTGILYFFNKNSMTPVNTYRWVFK